VVRLTHGLPRNGPFGVIGGRGKRSVRCTRCSTRRAKLSVPSAANHERFTGLQAILGERGAGSHAGLPSGREADVTASKRDVCVYGGGGPTIGLMMSLPPTEMRWGIWGGYNSGCEAPHGSARPLGDRVPRASATEIEGAADPRRRDGWAAAMGVGAEGPPEGLTGGGASRRR